MAHEIEKDKFRWAQSALVTGEGPAYDVTPDRVPEQQAQLCTVRY